MYDARVKWPEVDDDGYMKEGETTVVGLLGDCEHLRPSTQHTQRLLQANELVWLTDTTLHESLPLEVDGYEADGSPSPRHRQFFRVVTSNIGAWYAAHNTPNPTGVRPPPHIPVITKNKHY